MNPILLKPETNGGAQVIVQGRRAATLSARDYFANRDRFRPAVLESFQRLAGTADLIIVEGAGSPAEVNLRDGDLANMGFAARRQCSGHPHRRHPSRRRHCLAGRHIRGARPRRCSARFAPFSSTISTATRSLFDDGRKFIEGRTGVPCLGVIPHLNDARKLPAEDSLALDKHATGPITAPVRIAVLRLARIANFDDLDPADARDRRSPSNSSSRAPPCRPMPTSSSFPAPNRRSPICAFCASKAGTPISAPISGAAAGCSACAAAIRCWAGAFMTGRARGPAGIGRRPRPARCRDDARARQGADARQRRPCRDQHRRSPATKSISAGPAAPTAPVLSP